MTLRTPTPYVLFAMILTAAACGGETTADQASADEHLERTAREHVDDRPVAGAAAGAPVDSVTGRAVTYGEVDGRDLTGYLATPEGASDSLPGLIVIHEWWGLNDNVRTMARRLAARGYAALAVDLYGGAVAETSDSARALVGSVEDEAARANLSAAHAWIADRGAPRVASIGWCFGGGWSLQTALLLPEQLDAAVIYYGRLVDDSSALAPLAEHGLPIQGHFGAEDGSIPPSSVEAFGEALTAAGVTHDLYVYEGAGHAFANPSGERYQADAAETAWQRTVEFLAEQLKGSDGRG